MLYYYAIFTVFAIVAYMIVVDKNVAIYINLMIRYAGVQIKRAWWIARFHPNNPFSKLMMRWNVWKMTRELEKTLKISSKDLTDSKK